ncbi:IS5 family transposase [Streptomyces sp. BHT-5-2]|uniref:IS5 family transposase n=1 Tax=Streptomyces sp. BHT-5-2 TaxID=2866715 RepID=UPI001C8DB1B8|nr:IS5 family transposase [Streptomyces sp. BHT-5-2]QZL04270.1 IS5 family transposase [Streptomyces sp. BHT-5-2]
MPVLPSSLFEPVWEQFSALPPKRPEFDPAHPLGCHRRRVPDKIVFRLVVEALVHGSGYERVATVGCSDWTIRNRVKHWATLGLAQELHRAALSAYDKMIGLELSELSADGCHTKAPCQGDKAGPSPVDRGKQGLKRSTMVDSGGIPIGLASAGANRHDSVLLGPTIGAAKHQIGHLPTDATVHLDSAYDGKPSRRVLDEQGLAGKIVRKGVPAPIQVGKRWVVERTQSWMNGYGKIRRCFERDGRVVDFYLYLAAAFVTVRALIRQARNLYRWPDRPTARRLR